MGDDNKVEIYIDFDAWEKLDNRSKKGVLFHELLHDIYNIEHTTDSCDIMFYTVTKCGKSELESQVLNYCVGQL